MRTTTRTGRPGVTMIEFLMVIFIISVALGLLIPALHSAREAALRAQCTNNLKQIVLALHNYETQLNVLPPGVVNPTGPISNRPDDMHIGWIVQLLSYMEQGGVSLATDTRASVYAPANQTARGTNINSLHCPNDVPVPTAAVAAGLAPIAGASSYAACHHDVEAPIDADNHGMFYLNSALRHADIDDGSTHTIFVGEKRRDPDDLGWMSGTRATLRNTGAPLKAGRRDPDAPPGPPPPSELHVGGFESWHPGGANFAFGDGSVRFLSVTISPRILRLLGHRADGEPLGGSEY